jgi:hypothetical protein
MMLEFKTEREKEGKEEKAGKEKGTQVSMPFPHPSATFFAVAA